MIEKILMNKQFFSQLMQTIYNEENVLAATALQILILVLKNNPLRKENLEINLNLVYLSDLYDKNLNINPICSLITANLMGEILNFDNMLSKGLLMKLENISFFKSLNDLLTKKNMNKLEEIRKIEGSGFGCPVFGFNDGVIHLLQKIFVSFKNFYLNISFFKIYYRLDT